MMLGTNGECSSGGRRGAAGLVIVFRPRGGLSLSEVPIAKPTTTRTVEKLKHAYERGMRIHVGSSQSSIHDGEPACGETVR